MDLKLRLQRVLQVLEDAERVGALSDLERDMILADLRAAYSDVKFGTLCEAQKVEPEVVVPVAPQLEPQPAPQSEVEDEQEEQENEPEVEFEIIYNEEDDEDEYDEVENETTIAEPEPEVAPEPISVPESIIAPEPAVDVTPVVEEKPIAAPVEERVVMEKNLESELSAFTTTPRRSAILSLYEDNAPVVGEQFHEKPSVADSISCPKGVAESAPVASLRSAIGVADRFMIISELFGGDAAAFESAIAALDAQQSFDDCVIYISENYAWRASAEATKLIMTLLQRKFNE